uniref:Uncharacterized protein n=1 Tax=Meloidogyne hapla TaxID=6305 RepID=A0A1I8BVB7_MELHA
MSENRIISWDEAERILGETSNEPIKSSLPQQTRPTEPDNDTDVEVCMQKLFQNDPKLIEINLNNMKRTPVPKIKRMIEAIKDNEHLEKLSLANMGLYDMDLEPLIEVIKQNTNLRCLNLETNYLSGDFFAKLFKAALNNQSIEEVKAVNQGVAFSTQTEREIIEAIMQNRGLTKVSINLRLPEGRFKVEQATIRNQEIRRILRRQMLAEQKASVEEQKPKSPIKILPKKEIPQKEEKKTLKRQPSGAAAELAKQHIPAKLAIAGVNTPRPSTSESEPVYLEKKTAVRERAREADEKSRKPYEPEKNAERAILAEKSKQKNATVTASKWPPNSRLKSKDSKDEEEKPKARILKKQSNFEKDQQQKEETKNKIPSWRDRMAKRESEEIEKDPKINSLALRNKFEKMSSKENGEEEKLLKKPKSIENKGEKLANARAKFQQQSSLKRSTVESSDEEKKNKNIIKNNNNIGGRNLNKSNNLVNTNSIDKQVRTTSKSPSKSPPKKRSIIPPPVAKKTLINEDKPLNKPLINSPIKKQIIEDKKQQNKPSTGYIPAWRKK